MIVITTVMAASTTIHFRYSFSFSLITSSRREGSRHGEATVHMVKRLLRLAAAIPCQAEIVQQIVRQMAQPLGIARQPTVLDPGGKHQAE